MLLEVTDDNYQKEVADSDLPCVIGFTAGWCDLCPKMLEALQELSEGYGSRAKFCFVNTDENMRLRIAFAVAALPYVIFVENGTRTPLFDELVTKDRLKERIDYMLEGGKSPSTMPLKEIR